MARIAGVDIPKQKRGVISLTYIYGVGRSRAKEILSTAKVDESTKQRTENLGIVEFISKPFKKIELTSAVERVLIGK